MYKLVETKEDIRRISKMASSIWKETYQPILKENQISYMLEKFLSVKSIKEQINQGYQYYLLKEEKTAGFASILNREEDLFLSKLYVYEAQRSKGVGKKFIDYLKSLEKPIVLTVNKQNQKAIEFYQKEGFLIIEELVTDIGNNFVMDDYVMRYTNE
ncbi:MAG: GNAT family N-acetyltransferase [Paracholeplasma sp.]|nr:GNAT family N-acetyltransferase [Paracholeplasma sp.]MDY3195381.1 GNAT family N-acetyltransferase [Paracholeplasma sp.]